MCYIKTIKIHTDFIKLNQLLKWINAAESGSEANRLITEGFVKVNNEIELRRGKKIFPGDNVEIVDYGSFVIAKEGSADIVSEGIDP